MSYQIQPNDVLAIRLVTWVPTDRQLGVNVLHYRVAAITGGVPTGLNVAQAMDLLVDTVYKAWLGNVAQYRGVGVTKIWPLPRMVEDTTNANNGIGTGGANLAPQQTSGIIGFGTGLAGRKNRGRMYPAFPSAAWADTAGNMNAGGLAAITALNAAIPGTWAMANGGTSANLQQVIWHRMTNSNTDVITRTVESAFATQRRRGQLGRTNILPF